MEEKFNAFMHIYFWVFIVIFILGVLVNLNKEPQKEPVKITLSHIVIWVLFIMSFKY